MIQLGHFLAVAATLFGLGLVGFLTRRNFITMFLCAEMMLQGVVLNLLAFGKYHGHLGGQVFGLFIVTVAACEAGLALALFLVLYRRGKSLDSGAWQAIREPKLPPTLDTVPLPPPRRNPGPDAHARRPPPRPHRGRSPCLTRPAELALIALALPLVAALLATLAGLIAPAQTWRHLPVIVAFATAAGLAGYALYLSPPPPARPSPSPRLR